MSQTLLAMAKDLVMAQIEAHRLKRMALQVQWLSHCRHRLQGKGDVII